MVCYFHKILFLLKFIYLVNIIFFLFSNANSSFESIRAVFVNVHNLLDILINSRQCSIMEQTFSENPNNMLIEG